MNLTPEQKQAVSSWVAAGDNLSVVQRKLSEQFQLSMTYREVRFLVDDLNLDLKDTAPKVDASDVTKAPPPAAAARGSVPEKKGMLDKLKEKVGLGGADDEDEPAGENFPEASGLDSAPPAGGGVNVELDRVVRPGAVVSGTVQFSDGVSGKWALDQYGRLMLDTGSPGYKPSAADVQDFQRELSTQLQRHGF